MTTVEQELENARARFVQHIDNCARCRDFDHSARSMGSLCWIGAQAYNALLQSEQDYIVKVAQVPVARHPDSLRRRARDHVIFGSPVDNV